MTQIDLNGQVAVVTGGARGIGYAIAERLIDSGASCCLWDRDDARLAEAARMLSGRGAVRTVVVNVAQPDSVRAAIDATVAGGDRIDILVNNAGIYRAAATLDVTEEHWDAVMSINAKAVFFATQAVLPTMIAQKRGAIVSLASMAGKIGSRTNLPYNASKAAVISMTKSLALAHAADGIRVNCVCPGFVETDMWAAVAREQGALLGQSPEQFTAHRRAQVPLGRMERPEDVASVIAFLVSPRADYMTGQAVSVDGGLVMH
jgi:3-oxoacyl-[acyl-carrier protein] reductase